MVLEERQIDLVRFIDRFFNGPAGCIKSHRSDPHKYRYVTARTHVDGKSMIQGRRTGKGDDGAGFRFIQRGLCAIVWLGEKVKKYGRGRFRPSWLFSWTLILGFIRWKIFASEFFKSFEFGFWKFFIDNW